MRPTDPGVRLHLGTAGGGKTDLMQCEVYDGAKEGVPFVVIDQMYEWHHGHALVRTVGEATAAVRDGATVVIVRPDDAAEAAEEACAWACEDRERVRGVAFPEAHRVWPAEKRLGKAAMQAVTGWRHFNVAFFCDAQRPASLDTTIRELARQVRCFAAFVNSEAERRAFMQLGGLSGEELLEAIEKCNAHLEAGEPGYHVELGTVRKAPFVVKRR